MSCSSCRHLGEKYFPGGVGMDFYLCNRENVIAKSKDGIAYFSGLCYVMNNPYLNYGLRLAEKSMTDAAKKIVRSFQEDSLNPLDAEWFNKTGVQRFKI